MKAASAVFGGGLEYKMELFEHRCTRCGGELISDGAGRWKCPYCACTFDDNTAKKNLDKMRELLDENKREIVNNLRRNLYDAVNSEHVSSVEIQRVCTELKKYLAGDFRADFYSIASGTNTQRIAKYIRGINVEENYEHIGDAVTFLTRSLQPEFLLELNDLVERAYKYRDLTLYEKYATAISIEAEKVYNGVYETKLPREVFVAYSSKDMDKVMDLVECLEHQGLKCFVAARNLRHGRGAVENYDRAIKEAIDHCRTFVFVSSTHSRSLSCDALEIELPYVRQGDIDGAPSEFRNDYAAIPHSYKKPRVEYRIEESLRYNAADEITNEFFDGYERVYSPDEAASRIVRQLIGSQGRAQNEKKPSSPPAAKKFCVACGYESDASKKFCAQCGSNEFAPSVTELLKIREKKQRDAASRPSNTANQGVKPDPNKNANSGEDKIKSYQEIALNAYNQYLKNKPDTKNGTATENNQKKSDTGSGDNKATSQEQATISNDLKKLATDAVSRAANGINEFLDDAEKKLSDTTNKIKQGYKSDKQKSSNPYSKTNTTQNANPYAKHVDGKKAEPASTDPKKLTDKLRKGWLIATVVLSFLTVGFILSFTFTAVICFMSLTCMSVVMTLSPRNSRYVFGKEKGMPKWAFILICSLVSFVMVMI